jgi:hypothetical protein
MVLRLLAGYISKELDLVDTKSPTEIRNILLKHGIRYRQSKSHWETVLTLNAI